jgi:hypothetical protein
MFEILIRVLPLIFFSCAIGIVILNIRPILSYFIYIVSMAAQPKQLMETTQELEQRTEKSYKFSFSTPFVRLWTLIRVLFFPDLDMSGLIHKNENKQDDTISTGAYLQRSQEGLAAQAKIKTYSVAGIKDTSHFRGSVEPVQAVSSEFAQAFPELSKNLGVNMPEKSNMFEIKNIEIIRR